MLVPAKYLNDMVAVAKSLSDRKVKDETPNNVIGRGSCPWHAHLLARYMPLGRYSPRIGFVEMVLTHRSFS